MEIATLNSDILKAMKVCPDVWVSSSGPFVDNDWTKFVDHSVLHQPDQNLGFKIENYQSWLDWTYEELAESNDDDPILHYSKELIEEADGKYKIPWLMSFREKGFNVGSRLKTKSKLIFKTIEDRGWRIERELIPSRFGEPILLERTYFEGTDMLDDTAMVFKTLDNTQTILRFDNPAHWGYQQSWYRSFQVGGDAERIRKLAEVDEPVSDYLFRNQYVRDIHSGDFLAMSGNSLITIPR